MSGQPSPFAQLGLMGLTEYETFSFKAWTVLAPAGVARWIECRPLNRSGLIPSQGMYLLHIDVSLPLPPSLPLFLKINSPGQTRIDWSSGEGAWMNSRVSVWTLEGDPAPPRRQRKRRGGAQMQGSLWILQWKLMKSPFCSI